VLDGQYVLTTHALLDPPFDAPPTTFKGGVSVAVGDINGDGHADIVTASGAGPTTTVKVFDGNGYGLVKTFTPFGPGTAGSTRAWPSATSTVTAAATSSSVRHRRQRHGERLQRDDELRRMAHKRHRQLPALRAGVPRRYSSDRETRRWRQPRFGGEGQHLDRARPGRRNDATAHPPSQLRGRRSTTTVVDKLLEDPNYNGLFIG